MISEVFANSTLVLPKAATYLEAVSTVKSVSPHLTFMETYWAAWYHYMQNDVLATGLLFFCLHEFMYFGRCLPWFIIDCIPYFNQWKIQATKIPSGKEQWECFKYVLIHHFLVEAIPIWGFHPLCQKLGISVAVPFPEISTMLWQIGLFSVLEDSWHYWFHRLFHYGPFYKYIHKQHHRYAAPFGFAAEYAHPVETMALGFGTVGFPIVFVYFTGNLHLFTLCIWITLRLFQAIDSHSGYDFPWSLHNFVPFWAGAEHHDLHHHYFIGNYASSFRWWDFTLDTEAGPEAKAEREERMRLKAERNAKKAN
ncbi:hypothetical protein WICPIJ_005351 [Wickerhamomyces pijperi]|uniref:Fatty acid hydroxylase domain-containing protein n=1 Tax=Wickerhamomyces pijperi TaxID=599730 RepID=A0A9P8Q5X5_WICPI|nr:hypothetical protein WICPIJ_005351 [Wickerhamomyces pijperi]